MALSIEQLTLGVIIGALAAIVYSFRYLILLQRKIIKMDSNIEQLTKKLSRRRK